MPTATLANRYTILDTLGQGAMGVVYLVDDPIATRMAALKVISTEGRNERSVLQFKQEFRLMTQLRHPNCCEVYDYGVLGDGEPYFTMEIVPGKGLDECLPLSHEAFRSVFSQLMLALAYVHQQGFVHRDLKSMNVRLRPDGVVKLMDYGLMSYVGQTNPAISGTVAYMAPEVIKRSPVDPRSDLYSAGCLAYELLTGRCPFESAVPMEVLRSHVNDRPEPLYRLVPDIDPQVERIVLKLLEKEPLARYQSAQEVLEDLGVEVPPGLGGSLLTSPLVGREAELATLTGQLEATARGTYHALVLHGPPGIGKSRLVEAFRYAAQLELVPCAVGRLAELENAPYAPFTTALRALLPELTALVPTALARHASVLVKLLPELRVPPAPEMDHPNREKMRLQGAIAEVLTALARTRPIALVLEDWHWADDLSRDMLDYLLRNAQQVPLMVLVTTRETPTEALASQATPLGLAPLAPPDLSRMVASMLGTPEVEPSFLSRLAAICEGSPLHLERLLDHLVKQGVLIRQQGRWNMAVEIPPDTVLANLTSLLADRLTTLPPHALALAQAAAVAGPDAGLELLKDVTGFTDDELFDALSHLEQQRLLVQSQPGAYRFAQDMVRHLVYTQLGEAEQKRLHGRVARSLEAELWILPLPQVPFEQITAIANHCLLSDVPESAITYALEAGRRDAQLFAIADATRFLTAGLALIEADGSPVWDGLKLRYLRQIGDLRRVTGQGPAAMEIYQDAIALAERLKEPEAMGRMLTSLAKLQQEGNDLTGTLASCERALECLLAAGDKAGAARALDTSCRARYFAGDAATAIAEAQQALAYAAEAGDSGIRAHILAFHGYLCVAAPDDRTQEGVTYLKEAIAAFSEMGDPIGLNNATMLLGNAHSDLGEYQEAARCFTEARAICQRIAYRAELTFAVLNLGQVALERGMFLETEALAEESRQLALALGARYQEGLALLLAAAAGCHTGQVEAARAQLETAHAYALSLKNRLLETLTQQFRMDVELHLNDLPAAADAATRLSALIEETGFIPLDAKLRLGLAWLAAREGRHDEARALLAQALARPKFTHNKVNVVRARKLEAWLHLQAEEFDEARQVATAALADARALDHPYHIAELEGLLGEIALARGEDASAHFAAMAIAAETSGTLAAQAAARFGQAGARPLTPEAAHQAAEARNDLMVLLAEASEATRQAFLASRERQRLWGGDYHAFARPVAKQADAAAARNQAFGGSMFGMM